MDIFEEEIRKELAKHVKGDISLEKPDQKLGDYAFPCFLLAKEFKKSPAAIATDIAKRIKKNDFITEAKAVGPYINFFINRSKFAESIISSINGNYGRGENKNEKVMVEYFQANTHKGMHIGHIRNIALGEALARILSYNGFDVVRANYQGDIGPHVAKCLWGYYHLGGEQRLRNAKNKGVELGKLYAEANRNIEGNDELEEDVRAMTRKLYSNDPELKELWQETKQLCLDDFDDFYKEIGVKFDVLFFESEVEQIGRDIVKDLQAKGIAKLDQGAMIVDLKEYGLGVYLVLRSDGVPLYSTKDLALAKEKFEKFKIDRSIYVVGREQELYFQQLFKTLSLMGFKQAEKCHHLVYGLVMLPEGKMSSRDGNVILFQDLRDKLFELALTEVKSRHSDWDETKVKNTALKLALSALKFNMLNRESNKDIIFDIERSLDFEGETAAYVQYSYARICSIFKKFVGKLSNGPDFSKLDSEYEFALITTLSDLPSIIEDSARDYKPHIVARYALEIAKRFNEFYQQCPILKEEEKTRDARLHLADATKRVLEIVLGLLNIDLLEEM